jgi:drug/metabolite transporter (DMT)-like permease
MHSQVASGAALAMAAVVVWGAQFPIAKSAFAFVDPYHVSAIRYTLGTLLLVPLVAALQGRQSLRYYGRLWPASVLGLIGMTGSPLLVFAGLSLTGPEHTAIIVSLQPSMTAIADWLMRGRRPARFTLGCIAFAFLGVVLVVTRGGATIAQANDAWVGDGLVLAGALCWVVYTMGTEMFRGWSALKLTALTLIPGSIGLVVVTAALVPLGFAEVPTWSDLQAVSAQLAFLAVIGVAASFICWNAGNRRIGALNAMLMLNLIPVVTFTIGYLQGRRFVVSELAGAALVIGALAANNLYLRRTTRTTPTQAAAIGDNRTRPT